jgi:hypothetical protein
MLDRALPAVFGSVYSDFSLFTVDESDFFQAPAGLDVDVGGVNPALYQFVAASRFDSWFTVGADDGESQNALSYVPTGPCPAPASSLFGSLLLGSR